MIYVKKKTVKILALLLLCVITAAVGTGASAAGKEDDGDKKPAGDVSLEDTYNEKGFLTEQDLEKAFFEFDKKNYTVIYGDTIEASIKCNIPERVSRIEYSGISGVAGLSDYSHKDGTAKIKGYAAGSAAISIKMYVEFSDSEGMYEGEKMLESEAVINVLPVFDVNLSIGESYPLKYTDNDEYAGMEYISAGSLPNSGECVEFSDGKLTAVEQGKCDIYIQSQDGRRIRIGCVDVMGDDISFAETAVNRAVGSAPYQLVLNNAGDRSITWSSSNPFAASVDQSGQVTPVSVGVTTVTASYKVSETRYIKYTCEVNVTNPVLNISSFNLAKGYSADVSILGTTSSASWSSSNTGVADVSSGGVYYSYNNASDNFGQSAAVYAYEKGTAVISAEVDGVVRTLAVRVTDPKIKKTFYIVTKGSKQVIKVTGTARDSVVKYISGNKKVATVTSNGVVRVKKTGYCPVLVDVDGARFVVSFNAGKKNAVKAVNNALKVEGAIYSQARRMQKGYYDCSSLVWRSYKGCGMYFGDRHYAPVAANEAAYCVRTNKNVPAKYINNLNRLNVGDLIFYKRDSKNGRYKNIYHVAIYMGQCGETYGGDKIYTYGKIVHADGSRVSQVPLYNQSNCVVIGRPFK